MPRKSPIDREREAEADDLLLRALRQLADEALEEEIPERLLRPLREAHGRQQAAPDGPDGADRGTKRRGSATPRRRAGSG